MPCYVTGSEKGDMLLRQEELGKEVQDLTRLLCFACTILESEGNEINPRSALGRWWKKHKQVDAAVRPRRKRR